MKNKVLKLFKRNYSPYAIHHELQIGIKEVYHYLKQREEQSIAKKRKANEL